MDNKQLRHGTLSISLIGLVVSVFSILCLQWWNGFIQHAFGIIVMPGKYDFIIFWCILLSLRHCFLYEFPYTGIMVAVSYALGYAIGIALFAGFESPEVIAVSFISFLLVEYYGRLIRIKWLKKKGYIEQD